MKKNYHLVVGLGKTGHSIAAYLTRRDQAFALFDTRKNPEGLNEFSREFPQADIFLTELPASIYPQLNSIIASPGLSLEEPVFTQARELNIPIIGDIECMAREIKVPVIAITGTNGKSTVTTLVGEMLKASGLSTAVAGNIGSPVLDLLDDAHSYEAWVLELSSFQLELLESLRPLGAAILNISPDHLDRHHHLDAYVQAKQKIYQGSSLAVYNRDDDKTYPLGQTPEKLTSYGLGEPGRGHWGIRKEGHAHYLARGEESFLSVEDLAIKGQHNWQNALAACALAESLKVSSKTMIRVLQEFKGLNHRCQWVRRLDGIDWIDDSKGTNVGATLSAIAGIGASLKGKVILIAGGLGKGADFSVLQETIKRYVSDVVLIGRDAPLIKKALSPVVAITEAKDLEHAVLFAKELAKPEDVVLLSPACASQDMFRDFNHRGDMFIHWVNSL